MLVSGTLRAHSSLRPPPPLPPLSPTLSHGAALQWRRTGLGAVQRRQQQQQQQQHRRPMPLLTAAAAGPLGAGVLGGGGSAGRSAAGGLAALPLVGPAVDSLARYAGRISGVWQRFLPTLTLFFVLAFANTIVDSLKDTLVITAVGGGAACLPFLSLYAVLPASVAFLVAYSWASQRFSRATLFNIILTAFVAFFVLFAGVLLPNADTLHSHALADTLQQVLPAGLSGAMGMFKNWTYTLFFAVSEMFGDVCLGLLFWGLANDTTTLAEAPTIYPLLGLGANLAQALGGLVLKATTASGGRAPNGFVGEVQAAMAVVVVLAGAAMVLHQRIASQPRPERAADLPRPTATHKAPSKAPASAAAFAEMPPGLVSDAAAVERRASGASASTSSSPSINGSRSGSAGLDHFSDAWHQPQSHHQQQQQQQQQQHYQQQQQQQQHYQQQGQAESQQQAASGGEPPGSPKPGLRESFAVLAASPEIRCLAIMSLAQGLCSSVAEFAWKLHAAMLFPQPSQFTSYMGDVACATGVVTAALMLASPIMFERLGWSGVAGATPKFMLWAGSAFFAACILYQHVYGAAAAAAAAAGAAAPAAGTWLLTLLVLAGTLLYVFGKGARFSLFKPAEEMIYITLDEAGRTRGKAAIDVVGSQTGKSGGSLLQQVLLLAGAGATTSFVMPALAAVYVAMLRGWQGAVHDLSARRNYTMHSVEEDEEEWPRATAEGAAVVAAPPRPPGVAAASPLDAADLAARLQALRAPRSPGGGAGGSSGSGSGGGAGPAAAAAGLTAAGGTSGGGGSGGGGSAE